MAKPVTVFRFDYEKFNPKRGENVNWVTYIAGYDVADAKKFLTTAVGDVNVRQIGQECRLDAISDDIRNDILKSAQPAKKKPGRPPKKSKE